ncbi:hypothetical protein [Brachybacterium endophyticum]|uniref:hypothetical protein n=1 Tax=Brachybacterium endophyticum TaxID=2182385 RepID=UPI0010579B8F|nr:hypothetical protein [Brachybacterium endophyticum]
MHHRRRPGRTRWDLRGTAKVTVQDSRDLLTPLIARDLRLAWEQHLAAPAIDAASVADAVVETSPEGSQAPHHDPPF